MKNTIVLLLIMLLIACKSEKKESSTTPSTNEVKTNNNTLKSGDYSSLLIDFTCDIKISELAQVLEIPETDLSFSDNPVANKCTFNLAGFGINNIGENTRLIWGPSPSSKGQNKKEISSYLKRKKEGLKIMGMDIELDETGDCYIAYQPAHGRVIILNEHYDQMFLIHYGQKNANNNRTKEQHEALLPKMVDLANYLLTKHRK